ncbi:hypothetical protein KXR53_18765 [Inquilinus limosus]|uniref:hypothetical protein n=1 Tax=Inquilinus limosus TaxID=171674 RepID=UPI003F13B87D
MEPEATKVIDALDIFDPQMRTLAALQHVPPQALDLRSLPINLEAASADTLKLGLIVVGLDRAPANLFHPRHGNADIVKALGAHDDPIVAQYTVWAVAENDNLTVDDLGIPISSVESRPGNVRGWMYRAVAMHTPSAVKYQDYIANGAGDTDAEVRLGLAIGLKDTYFDGLEAVVLDWYINEEDSEVSQSLLDHMVRHSDKCYNYEQCIVERYESEGKNSLLRRRMEGLAARTTLYLRLMRISYDGSSDLFRGEIIVSNNTTINGGVQAGAFAIGGNASNSAATQIHYESKTVEAIQGELAKAIRGVHESGCTPNIKEEALEHVRAAQIDPSPDKITKAIITLKKVEAAASQIAGIGSAATSIGTTIVTLGKLSGLIS